MPRAWIRILLLGLWAGALAGCYVVSPYPVYVPPPPQAVPPPAGPPGAPAPGPGAPSAGAGRCETVLVEGHWETYVRPGGQQERAWVPARNVQECR